jgi:FHS family L-fucose permease-like MFS transporter
MKAKLTDRQYVVPFVLITTLFFLWGFSRAILDVLNKHFQNSMDISITQSSLIQVTTYVSYFLLAIPAGLYINRWGYRKGVVLGLSLFGVGALSARFASMPPISVPGTEMGPFSAFLLSLFVIGCGLVFLEVAANPYVTELGPRETATSRLNFSQSFNGFGSLFATFAVGQFLFRGSSESDDVILPYTILGIIVLVIAVVFSRVDLPEIKHEEDENEGAGGLQKLGQLWKHKMFVFGLFALLAYEVAEISINSYFINFVTGTGWMSDRTASVVLTFALAFFMVGRFVGAWIMRRVEASRMLFICGVGTVVCTLLVLCPLGKLSMVALMGNYFFEAIMFPTIFSLAVRDMGALTKSASSLLMMTPIGGCGFMLMCFMADHTNLFVPFIIPLIGFAVVLAYAVSLLRKLS